ISPVSNARLLDVHSDADHNRSVFTLAGGPTALAQATLAGAREAVARIDLHQHSGVHPRIGALDVAPIVYLRPEDRGAACAAALEDARTIAAAIREGGGEGLPSLRALGLWLAERGVAQVSMNLEDPIAISLAAIVEAIAKHAAPARVEVVGLVPRQALAAFPESVPLELAGTIEDALSAARSADRENV